jgi:penicillin-binding protein 2
MKNKRNVFAPLTGVKSKATHVTSTRHSKNERWLFGVLPGDNDAPTVEDEKSAKRFYGLFFGVFVLFALLFGRAFYLQVIKGQASLMYAQENRFRQHVIRAPRGLFYDRNKIPLVKNIPNYEVTVIPSDLPQTSVERNEIYLSLSKVIGLPESEIKKITESKEDSKKISDSKKLAYTQPIVVSKSVSRDVSLVFESKQSEFRGFYVGINPIREYLDSGLLSHAFGYVGRISEEELEKRKKEYILTDYIGKSGLEKNYESVLRGKSGAERVEVDSKGKIIRTYGQENPVIGDNIQLSIDFELQKKLTESLTKQMEVAKVKKAAAVAVNPQNGEVLAFVSLPSYDNNLFAKGISEADYNKLAKDENSPLLDRVISGEYPSGSIIKPYVAAAALEEGTVNESTTVQSTGGIKIGDITFPDWKAGGHGTTNVIKAIAESVNTYFYSIGGGYNNIRGLGPETIKKYLEKFGFNGPVGIDIGGESEGNIPDPEWKERVLNEPWYLGNTYNMSIGQGDLLVTPIQMANALQAVANGGTMYKLHFEKAILDASGNVKSEKSPEVVKKDFISAKTIDIVRRGMRATVTSGSARSLSSLPVEAAGKTGTAQFGPNNSKKHAWFTAFAPFDKPTIAIVVLVEGGGEGSTYAVPVAKDTLQWYFTRPTQ